MPKTIKVLKLNIFPGPDHPENSLRLSYEYLCIKCS